ncbi:hypothetical protein [Nonomuraea jiangxiensis]|uniref:hypothetical protein n=1 Tax=Nonomuraea jiangxiensis TaxID=633440 RepID=UPI00115FEA9D|nr:hypothetical protein [Nonomuraea jiangxiensis]
MQRILEHRVIMAGSMVGGPDVDREVEVAMRDITIQLQELQGERHAPFLVNLVYMIGGEFISPDFSGLRTGKFSRKRGILVIEGAVPEGPLEDAFNFLHGLLVQSLDVVEEWATKRKRLMPISEMRQITSAIRKRQE